MSTSSEHFYDSFFFIILLSRSLVEISNIDLKNFLYISRTNPSTKNKNNKKNLKKPNTNNFPHFPSYQNLFKQMYIHCPLNKPVRQDKFGYV